MPTRGMAHHHDSFGVDRELLRHIEELSFPEIALRLGRTEDSVKNLWVRALARLRRGLEDRR